jgi:putative transcriptional regulator
VADGLGAEFLSPGRLLVANPLLPDPNFDRTVVLLLAYGEEGALGLVLNRPSETRLAAPLPEWEQLAASPAVLFMGGPVQHQAVICLARAPATNSTDGWKAVTEDLGTVDLEMDPTIFEDLFSEVRVFAGYAGWAAGQLESEVAADAWWVVDGAPDDPFCDQPDDLWKRVLRRQRGRLALVASYPDDPNMN